MGSATTQIVGIQSLIAKRPKSHKVQTNGVRVAMQFMTLPYVSLVAYYSGDFAHYRRRQHGAHERELGHRDGRKECVREIPSPMVRSAN